MTDEQLVLSEFRTAKDEFFRTDPQSPLTPEQKKEFKGLNYFPENDALRFETGIETFPERSVIEIQTSTGDVQRYQRYGKIHFEVNGTPAELTLFANQDGFFLPFVDSLANKETYGAGRYLEPEVLSNGKLLVDFNMSYNPYCAYSPTWSCPMTPFENRLKVPIEAGEKIPEGNWVEHE